jgi:AcrR family transcriptional regulator
MRTAATPEETDSRIVAATLELLGKVGHRGTTTRGIAERAGVNEVTLFRRFGSKESLEREAISRAQVQLGRAFEEKKRERTGDLTVDVTRLALSMMEILAKRADSVAAILFEARSEPFMQAAAESMMAAALRVAREFFKGYAEEWHLDEEDVESISLSIVSFCFFRIVVRERILGSRLTGGSRKEEFENHVHLLLAEILRPRGRNLPQRSSWRLETKRRMG